MLIRLDLLHSDCSLLKVELRSHEFGDCLGGHEIFGDIVLLGGQSAVDLFELALEELPADDPQLALLVLIKYAGARIPGRALA